jgi:hypothetical protein
LQHTDFGLNASHDLTRHLISTAEFHYKEYSDRNQSNELSSGPQYSFEVEGGKLMLAYDAGCINGFTSVWHSSVIQGGNYFVEVCLEPTRKFACVGGEPNKIVPGPQA